MQKPLATVAVLALIAGACLPALAFAQNRPHSVPLYGPPAGTMVVGGAVRHGGAYRHGPRVGVYFGTPFVWGWPWGWPGYYPPAVAYPQVVTPPDVVYVEKGDDEQPAPPGAEDVLEPGYWYYCRERAAYYPAARQCPSGWEKVPPIRK